MCQRRGVWAAVLVALCVAAVEARGNEAPSEERPLAGLPSKPGPHINRIRALPEKLGHNHQAKNRESVAHWARSTTSISRNRSGSICDFPVYSSQRSRRRSLSSNA